MSDFEKLINASDLIEWIMETYADWCEYPVRGIVDHVDELSPAQPERKTGRWKKISPAGIYECDLCGKHVMTKDIDAYDFCHGCGAKMETKQTLSEADNDTAYGGLMSAT